MSKNLYSALPSAWSCFRCQEQRQPIYWLVLKESWNCEASSIFLGSWEACGNRWRVLLAMQATSESGYCFWGRDRYVWCDLVLIFALVFLTFTLFSFILREGEVVCCVLSIPTVLFSSKSVLNLVTLFFICFVAWLTPASVMCNVSHVIFWENDV